jgi:cation transport regulator ChaC
MKPLTLPGGIAVPAATVEALQKLKQALDDASWYPYPWEGLEDDLVKSGREEIALLGYGSLVSRTSAALTVTSRDRVAAIGFGIRRVFNYEIPRDNPRYPAAGDAAARAALNVRLTETVGDAVNGVLLDVPRADIDALRKREVAYDLLQVPCLLWGELERDPTPAWVVRSPEDGNGRTNNALTPHPDYYNLCRTGASRFGDSYLAFWLGTTYLADGVTPVAEWEENRSAG